MLRAELLERSFRWLEERSGRRIARRIVDGRIYSRLEDPEAEEVIVRDATGDGTDGRVDALYEEGRLVEEEYLALCRDFELTRENFLRFTDLFARLNAYMYLNYNYRAYLESLVTRQARELGIPGFFLNQHATAVQRDYPQHDEGLQQDTLLLEGRIAGDPALLGLFTVADESAISKDKAAEVLKALGSAHAAAYEALRRLASSYKISEGSDMRRPPPVELHVARIMRDLLRLRGAPARTETARALPQRGRAPDLGETEYFPDYPGFQRLARASIRAKLQMNNFHHTKLVGQWQAREALMALGEKLVREGRLRLSEEAFDLGSAEISGWIDELDAGRGVGPKS